MTIVIPLASGFEEIEAITVIDMLRRADLEVTTAAVGENPVQGSHEITLFADALLKNLSPSNFTAIVLPGGMPGSQHLKESDTVADFIRDISSRDGHIAAICAAPMVLANTGILQGKKATVFPGFEKFLSDANLSEEPVVVDGKIITARGAGCAIPFALKIIEHLKGRESALQIQRSMQVYWM